MFHGMGPIETGVFELGMEAQRQGILEEEQCLNCNGRGQVRVGCAITHAVYTTCCHCSGTGKRNRYLEKFLEEQGKLKKQK